MYPSLTDGPRNLFLLSAKSAWRVDPPPPPTTTTSTSTPPSNKHFPVQQGEKNTANGRIFLLFFLEKDLWIILFHNRLPLYFFKRKPSHNCLLIMDDIDHDVDRETGERKRKRKDEFFKSCFSDDGSNNSSAVNGLGVRTEPTTCLSVSRQYWPRSVAEEGKEHLNGESESKWRQKHRRTKAGLKLYFQPNDELPQGAPRQATVAFLPRLEMCQFLRLTSAGGCFLHAGKHPLLGEEELVSATGDSLCDSSAAAI